MDNDYNSQIISEYSKFIDNFIANAKYMDAQTARFINENYIDLLAR